jgi:hypothetical protein
MEIEPEQQRIEMLLQAGGEMKARFKIALAMRRL